MLTGRKLQRELQRTRDRLLRADAEELIEILSAHFEVPVPTLRWSQRSVRGYAYYTRWLIAAGPLVWRGTTNCLLHEFAHLLAYRRYGKDGEGHKRRFIETLIEVVEAWHGDVTKYGWGTEYITVAAAGPPATNNQQPTSER